MNATNRVITIFPSFISKYTLQSLQEQHDKWNAFTTGRLRVSYGNKLKSRLMDIRLAVSSYIETEEGNL